MRSDLWPRTDRLLERALELPPDERRRFVDEACDGDEALRRDVLRVLEADERAAGFLDRPLARLTVVDEPVEDAVDEVGARAGPYRLVRTLGRGGMGTVYLGRREDETFRREVAIKVLRRDLRGSEMHVRLRAERQILARLIHPSIARLYDGGTMADGRPYLVMELVDGLPIDRYCDRRRLTVDQRLMLFLEVCDAVEHAHRNLLIHRDLKPSNILVTAEGVPKLLDFGIAKPLDHDDFEATLARTRTGLRPMTLGYASPEQIRGEPLTTASDTYALGVLLYRLLAGRVPYRLQGDLAHELERAILEQDPERPSDAVTRLAASSPEEAAGIVRARAAGARDLRRRLRGDLDTIVLMALRKRPERRYGTARELARDLERHLDDRPVLARPDALGYRFGKLLRRNVLAASAASLIVLLVLGFFIVTLIQSGRIVRERDRARLESARAQQVSTFLEELFEASDPGEARGEPITAREMLDRGARKLDELADQPELQAALMSTMGRVYRNLGHYPEASRLLTRALELRRAVHPGPHRDVASDLAEIASLRQDEGDYDAAEPLFREALEMLRELLGHGHVDTAGVIGNLALLLHYKGDYPAAETLYRESLAILRSHAGDEQVGVVTTIGNLALLRHEIGDYEGAEPLYREALDLGRRVYGENHSAVASWLNNLAGLRQDLKDYESAEALFQQSLAMRRELFGDRHPSLVIPLVNLGDLWSERGDAERAESFYRQALEFGEILGEDHPRVANAVAGLSGLRLAAGEMDEGEALIRRALEVYRRVHAPGHWRTAYAECLLGGFLSARGEYHQAEPLLIENVPRLRASIGDREPITHHAVRLTVDHYRQRDLPARAAEYRALLETLEATDFGPEGPRED